MRGDTLVGDGAMLQQTDVPHPLYTRHSCPPQAGTHDTAQPFTTFHTHGTAVVKHMRHTKAGTSALTRETFPNQTLGVHHNQTTQRRSDSLHMNSDPLWLAPHGDLCNTTRNKICTTRGLPREHLCGNQVCRSIGIVFLPLWVRFTKGYPALGRLVPSLNPPPTARLTTSHRLGCVALPRPKQRRLTT